MRARVLVVLSLVMACNEIAGINEPIDKDGTGPNNTSGADGGGAQSDASSSAGEPTARYVGQWTGPGLLTLCGETAEGTADFTISKISDSAIQLKGGPCTFRFTIDGDVARATKQTCTRSDLGQLGTVKFDYATITFTLGDPTHYEGKGIATDSTGAQCEFVEQAAVNHPAN